MVRKIVTTPKAEALFEKWGIAPAIMSGDLLFIGGQIGIRPDGSASLDPEEQIEQAFKNMGEILDSAGASFDDVVDLTAFYTNYGQHGSLVRPIREKFFGTKVLTNWTAVGVSELAEPFIFEIKAIARLPDA